MDGVLGIGEVKIGFAGTMNTVVVRSITDITRGHLESLFSLDLSAISGPIWCLLT